MIPQLRRIAQEQNFDVDDSSSSSFQVEDYTGQRKRKRARYSSTTNKAVGFDETQNVSYRNNAVFKEDNKVHWYSHEEYQRFKTEVCAQALKIREADKKAQKCEIQSSSLTSYASVVEKVHRACYTAKSEDENVIDSETKKRLDVCLTDSAERLGLECISLPIVGRHRLERRQSLYRRIARAQKMFPPHHPLRGEALRFMSEQTSRPSRLFARFMATQA